MGKMFITNVHASATYYILDTTCKIYLIYITCSLVCVQQNLLSKHTQTNQTNQLLLSY